MKTILQRTIKMAFSLAVLLLMNAAASAQTSITMRLQNAVQINPNQFTYDVVLQNTGTTNAFIRGYSWGINHAAGMNNGGTITHTFITRDPLLSTIPNVGPGYTAATNHLRVTTLNATAGNEVAFPSGSTILLATMRVSTTALFPADFNPALAFQALTQSGRTQCVATCIIGGTSYAINAVGNSPIAGTLQALTPTINAPCFYLSPTSTLSATNTNTTAVNCFGGSDGTAEITLAGTGSGAVGTYSVDGGTSTAYFSNPFTVTGLAGGTHTIAINTAYNCTASTTTTISSPTTPITISENASACDTYTWPFNGATYTASGTYTGTALNTAGCTVLGTLTLNINNSTNTLTTAASCLSYTWAVNNTTYTASGSYTVTSMNAAGCLHSDILDLTIYTPTTSSDVIVACDSYTWTANGATYTNSGMYSATYLNAGGCVHTANLDLTINNSTSSSDTQIACDSYTWALSGLTYTTSGTYTFMSTNSSGCPHTNILNLTINNSTSTSTIASACDSYTWAANNVTYTASGIYTITSMNSAGCLHSDNLNLTINYSSSSSVSATACDSYFWSENNTTYTNSGTYTITSMNASGCFHTSQLVLTVNYSSASTSTVTACDSYTWAANGTTYTTSGTYTATSLNTGGCTETLTLVLTVNYSSASSSNGIYCDSYTFNGQTYTTSGSATVTSLNAAGCVHTHTEYFTINYSSASSSNGIYCDSYTFNGQTYTTSGSATVTSLNAAGCTHTHTEYFTINYSSASTDNATVCDSYLWAANGQTYTASGVYTATSLNAGGCLHTSTLNLVVNYSTNSSTTVTACGSYTWAVDGQTYTASGTYTSTVLNTAGCTHTSTLNLTIIHGSYLAVKAILSGSYNTSTGLMNDNLRTLNLVPGTEPYSAAPYNKPTIMFPNGETVSAGVLAVTGNDAIVDWVFLELRSATNSSLVVGTIRALIQRDGDVVSAADGVSPVFLPGVLGGSYYVSLKHRNHLGVMTSAPVNFSYCTTSSIDFTSGSVWVKPGQIFGPRRMMGAVATLWSSDANNNKATRYNGLSNDKDAVLTAVGAGTPNNVLSNVYRMEDVNMDGFIKYNNLDNDRVVIYNTVIATGGTNNSTINQHTPN